MLSKFFKAKASTAEAARLEAAERAKARMAAPKAMVDPIQQRGSHRPQDRVLMALTVLWADQLPSTLRPDQLLECYPRVANRLALCWGDIALTNRLFEELLLDRRGGRKGFPPLVKAELGRLRINYPNPTAPKIESPTPHWDLHSQAPSDR